VVLMLKSCIFSYEMVILRIIFILKIEEHFNSFKSIFIIHIHNLST